MGSSYTWCNCTRVTPGVTSQELHLFGPLICIRSEGEKNTHSHVFIVP